MTDISRERAVCLFYAVEYTEENKAKYVKIINEMEDVNICYSRNPKKPRLLCTKIINANALDIHLYQLEADQKQLVPTSAHSNKTGA